MALKRIVPDGGISVLQTPAILVIVMLNEECAFAASDLGPSAACLGGSGQALPQDNRVVVPARLADPKSLGVVMPPSTPRQSPSEAAPVGLRSPMYCKPPLQAGPIRPANGLPAAGLRQSAGADSPDE